MLAFGQADHQDGSASTKVIDLNTSPAPKPLSKNAVFPPNTVEIDGSAQELPSVTHEVVQPTEHHVTHEDITREIHYHDVFHRILPVYDLEILPTRHFVPDPEHPSLLKEISEAEAPARNNWFITSNTTPASDHPDVQKTPNDSIPTLRQLFENEDADPVLVGQKSYITEKGIRRTEYVWRHPPTIHTAAHECGDVLPRIPLRSNYTTPDEYAQSLLTEADKYGIIEASTTSSNQHGANKVHEGAQTPLAGFQETPPIDAQRHSGGIPESRDRKINTESPHQVASPTAVKLEALEPNNAMLSAKDQNIAPEQFDTGHVRDASTKKMLSVKDVHKQQYPEQKSGAGITPTRHQPKPTDSNGGKSIHGNIGTRLGKVRISIRNKVRKWMKT